MTGPLPKDGLRLRGERAVTDYRATGDVTVLAVLRQDGEPGLVNALILERALGPGTPAAEPYTAVVEAWLNAWL